jgi:hypothetical protein
MGCPEADSVTGCNLVANRNGPAIVTGPFLFDFIGRDDWIRTSDPLTPSPIPTAC